MIKREEVYKIGIFNKPHGIHGELSFTFTDDIFDRVEAEYLICLLDGILVPFFLEEYRFRSDTTALVKLEGVDTAERARMFTNIEVYFPVKTNAEEAGPGELSWDVLRRFRYGGSTSRHAGRSDGRGHIDHQHTVCGRLSGRRTAGAGTRRVYHRH